ncbi:MAG: 16S rRNA (uracil(1498)-N(3))-methyltransferase [Clostridiales bacterium]|nr:16S rRNA (uracil(1498)-N(3))-methyltransferase [Clostridiales bacterium]
MHQFFVDGDKSGADSIEIVGGDANHIKNVLRMRPGENLRVRDDAGNAYLCHIAELWDGAVVAAVDGIDSSDTELPNQVFLFQGLPKGSKMETVVQKSVELGTYEIIPVAMRRSVAKLDGTRAEGKVRRWQAIAEGAAKQSGRSIIPKMRMPVSWDEALKIAEGLDVLLVPYENEQGMDGTREAIQSISKGATVGVFIGPEGGFDGDEIASLPGRAKKISLGKRILRTETAGMATLAMLVYALES